MEAARQRWIVDVVDSSMAGNLQAVLRINHAGCAIGE
jgi:hypothetical protein